MKFMETDTKRIIKYAIILLIIFGIINTGALMVIYGDFSHTVKCSSVVFSIVSMIAIAIAMYEKFQEGVRPWK